MSDAAPKTIDLAAIERSAHSGAPDRVKLFREALSGLQNGMILEGALSTQEGYTRLAAALAAMLLDRKTALTEEQRKGLILFNHLFANLFMASGFTDAGFARELLRAGAQDREAIERELILLTPDLASPDDIDRLLALPAPLNLLMAIVFAGSRPVFSLNGETRRDAMLARADEIAAMEAPPSMDTLVLLANAWMNSSYSAAPNKHAIKAALNQVLLKLLKRLDIEVPSPPPRQGLKTRPVMVVAAEVMHEHHVQYRYFGQYLRQLRTRFETVLVTPAPQVTPAIPELFDQVRTFDQNSNRHAAEAAEIIWSLKPDVVFWPSVGMARWGPLLANVRFAPIQMTALGHSASTFCGPIDYYLTEEGYVGDPALFSEKLLLVPDDSLRFETPAWRGEAKPRQRGETPRVVIAIPSNAGKLNPTFIATLARIRAAAKTRVQFRFFPNKSPMETEALANAWLKTLGDAVFFPRLNAARYLDALNMCDMVLSPFPFGGLHSTVDALRHGLPVVAWEGLEPHSRTDSLVLRRAGMPERLICQDVAAYEALAVEMIDNAALRLEMGAAALACDVEHKMFAQPGAPLRTEIVDAVWAAYRHHEKIMAGGQVWRLDDLKALG